MNKDKKQVYKKIINGEVIKIIDQQTVKIEVERKAPHPKYGKIIKSNRKYLVNTEGKEVKVGDKVTAEECNPVSKKKAFKLVS